MFNISNIYDIQEMNFMTQHLAKRRVLGLRSHKISRSEVSYQSQSKPKSKVSNKNL